MVVRGRIHGQLSWQGLIRVDLQEMDLDLSGNDLAEAMCDEEGRKLAAGWASYNSVVDHRIRQTAFPPMCSYVEV